MVHINNKVDCTGCAACENGCPKQAIHMQPDEEGFLYPQVDLDKCVECGFCEKICPLIQHDFPDVDLEHCYAAYNLNESERMKSSSGGIFVLLARDILRREGIVFGAALNDKMAVQHMGVEKETELENLLGSKYAQSYIGKCYQTIKEELNKGRYVLFAGTSCQVGGLRKFLKKDYERLFCIDIICLGIPSPQIWQDYLHTFFAKRHIESINFKDKSIGWHRFSLSINSTEEKWKKDGRQTHYFTGYFKGLYSRPSCSNCIYKGKNRVSDITISDCWGFHEIAPEMDDNKGLSSVICHTEKGMQLFEAIKPQLCWKEADIADVRKHNKNYCCSAPMGEERQEFWKTYHERGAKKAFRKYCEPEQYTFFARVKRKAKKTIKSMKKKDV